MCIDAPAKTRGRYYIIGGCLGEYGGPRGMALVIINNNGILIPI